MQANTPSVPKRRHVLHCSGVRGEKGGLFFTVPGCAVKKAARFSPFRAARSKTEPPFTPPNTRGDANGGLLEGMSDEEGLQGLSLEAVADVARGSILAEDASRYQICDVGLCLGARTLGQLGPFGNGELAFETVEQSADEQALSLVHRHSSMRMEEVMLMEGSGDPLQYGLDRFA